MLFRLFCWNILAYFIPKLIFLREVILLDYNKNSQIIVTSSNTSLSAWFSSCYVVWIFLSITNNINPLDRNVSGRTTLDEGWMGVIATKGWHDTSQSSKIGAHSTWYRHVYHLGPSFSKGVKKWRNTFWGQLHEGVSHQGRRREDWILRHGDEKARRIISMAMTVSLVLRWFISLYQS